MKDKIKTKEEISEIVSELRKGNPNIRIVTTNGAFDIMHSGHIHSLEKSKSHGDVLIVGLNSDSSIKQYKSSNRPIIPQKQRAEMLAALECVNHVVIFDETNPCSLLEAIKPNFHVKSKSGFTGIETDVVQKNGGKIVLIEDIPGISTTEIIHKIKSLSE